MKITQLENALTALKQIETLIREDCKNACDLTPNQAISLGIISTVLNGKAWKVSREVKEIHNG